MKQLGGHTLSLGLTPQMILACVLFAFLVEKDTVFLLPDTKHHPAGRSDIFGVYHATKNKTNLFDMIFVMENHQKINSSFQGNAFPGGKGYFGVFGQKPEVFL